MPHKQVSDKDGNDIPSVTTVLSVLAKPHLYRWYAVNGWDKCEQIKRESAEYGTQIHEQVSAWLKGDVPDFTHEPLVTFQNAYCLLDRKPVEVEPPDPYVSTKYGYQGTFDWVELDGSGELIMADLKVTNAIYPEMSLQLAAYAQLYNEKHGTDIKLGRIYNLNKKTGKLQIKEFDQLNKKFKVFRALLDVYNWVNGD